MNSRFTREMQITAAEFMRQVAGAVAPLPTEICGDQVRIRDGDRLIIITLVDEEVKHLGSLEFAGYSVDESEAFMHTFDQRTLRTGGL